MTDHEVSRIFRSSFPEAERSDFRTGAWRVVPRTAADLKPLHATLLHAFATAAKLEDTVGITLVPEDEDLPEEHRTYRKMYEQSKLIAAELHERGVKPGERVLLVLPTGFEFILAFFAVERLGAIPVPSYPPALLEKAEIALERIQHIAAHSEASCCVTNRLLLPLLGSLGQNNQGMREIVAVEKLLEGKSTSAPKARAQGGDPAFIQYTSGSTGHPKGVLLSHTNLVANIHAAGLAVRIGRKDVVVSWLPLYHDMGLIGGLLFAFYWRLPLALMAPTTFLLRPARWLWTIHKHRGTLSASPNFGYALCVKRVRPRDREGLNLSSWRASLNGAEPVNLRTVNEFIEAFEPHGFRPETMLPVYGLAESSVALTFPAPGEPVRSREVDRASLAAGWVEPPRGSGGSTTVVAVGRAIPGHTVQVVDAQGGAVAPDEVGHIIARGPSIMQGYYRDPKATAGVLRGGWLWTGDLGFQDEDGRLFVTGRAKDLIIIRGKNYYAEDLEHVIERLEGVRGGGAVCFALYDEEKATDLVVAICETKVVGEKERALLVEQVNDAVSRECGVTLDEVVLVAPGTIPKTSSGKRQRALSRELYVKDELVPTRSGKLDLALVFARSGRGFLSLLGKRLRRKLRIPA